MDYSAVGFLDALTADTGMESKRLPLCFLAFSAGKHMCMRIEFSYKRITVLKTGEKAQELRTLAALIEDLSSVPSTLIGQLTVACNLSNGGPPYHPLLAPTGTPTQTHT